MKHTVQTLLFMKRIKQTT